MVQLIGATNNIYHVLEINLKSLTTNNPDDTVEQAGIETLHMVIVLSSNPSLLRCVIKITSSLALKLSD